MSVYVFKTIECGAIFIDSASTCEFTIIDFSLLPKSIKVFKSLKSVLL